MIDINIRPRQSNKTNEVLELYRSKDNSVMFSFDERTANYITRKHLIEHSYSYKNTKIGWSNFDNIYFDECFKMQNLPMDFLHYLTEKGKTVYMVGTPSGNMDENMEKYMFKYLPEYFI